MLIKSTNLSQPSLKWPDDWGQGARGCWAGGGDRYEGGDYRGNITYCTIATLSDSITFGSPLQGLWRAAGSSGRGRGIIAGGVTGNGNNVKNDIHYVTVSVLGNSTDFGDLTVARQKLTSTSNGTRSIMFGGATTYASNPDLTSIDYITIATTGNASNFGNLTSGSNHLCDATGDGVYGMTFCNVTGGGYGNDKYDYVAIDTPGNTTAFGTVANATGETQSANSNGARAFWAGGYNGGNPYWIDYLTWSTPSNGIQYGLLRINSCTVAEEDGSRAVIGGGDGFGSGTNTAAFEYFSMDLAAGTSVVAAAFGTLDGSEDGKRQYAASFAG